MTKDSNSNYSATADSVVVLFMRSERIDDPLNRVTPDADGAADGREQRVRREAGGRTVTVIDETVTSH